MSLPKDKYDHESMLALLHHPDASALQPLIPVLLQWIQDMNWPIAEEAVAVLRRCPHALVDPIRGVLQADDEEWMYNCLSCLVMDLPDLRTALRDDITALQERKQNEDDEWELRVLITEILNMSS